MWGLQLAPLNPKCERVRRPTPKPGVGEARTNHYTGLAARYVHRFLFLFHYIFAPSPKRNMPVFYLCMISIFHIDLNSLFNFISDSCSKNLLPSKNVSYILRSIKLPSF